MLALTCTRLLAYYISGNLTGYRATHTEHKSLHTGDHDFCGRIAGCIVLNKVGVRSRRDTERRIRACILGAWLYTGEVHVIVVTW